MFQNLILCKICSPLSRIRNAWSYFSNGTYVTVIYSWKRKAGSCGMCSLFPACPGSAGRYHASILVELFTKTLVYDAIAGQKPIAASLLQSVPVFQRLSPSVAKYRPDRAKILGAPEYCCQILAIRCRVMTHYFLYVGVLCLQVGNRKVSNKWHQPPLLIG